MQPARVKHTFKRRFKNLNNEARVVVADYCQYTSLEQAIKHVGKNKLLKIINTHIRFKAMQAAISHMHRVIRKEKEDAPE